MKKTLKQLRQLVADAKAAWQKAKKDKYAADLIARFRANYEAKLALIEGAEDEGKKDEDEIEVKADLLQEIKAAEPNALELADLEKMIAKNVETALAAKLPEFLKGQLKADDVAAVVKKALADHKIDASKVTAEQIKTVSVEALNEAVKTLKMPSKLEHGKEDGEKGGDQNKQSDNYGMVEMPYSLSKGNLPLHMKQLLNRLMNRPQDDGIPESVLKKGIALGDNMFLRMQAEGVKALTTTGTGTGAEWIPRDMSSELTRRMYLESRIAQRMLAREIQMPTDPYDAPIALTRPKFYRNNVQNREARASTPTTGKYTLATQRIMALVQYSYEANEDSIIPILPLLQTLLGEASAEALESMLINGDTAATHMDADITDPDDVNKGWDGWRKLALAQAALKVDMSTGNVTRGNLLAVKKAMGKWSRNPSDLVWITGGITENDFLNLDEVITADKRGAAGTTVTGTINSYWGIPIEVSEVMREDLNAAGVYDGVTTTKASLLLVNLALFFLGSRREFMIETGKNIKSQTNDIVASFRKAFRPAEPPAATSRSVAVGYNFAP